MSFLSKEEVASIRNKSGTKVSLLEFIGIDKNIVVCEVSLNAGLKLKDARNADDDKKTELVLSVISDVVFDEQGNKLTRDDVNQLFELANMDKGTKLLEKIQTAAFKAEGPAGN